MFNRSRSLGELLAKSAAASNTNGVVGKRGITIPNRPRTSDIKPRVIRIIFT